MSYSSPGLAGVYVVILSLLLLQYCAVPALLAGFLGTLAGFSPGVLFAPLVLMFQSSKFSVYEILFFVGCAHWLVSCVKLIRNKEIVKRATCRWWLIFPAMLGALCLFKVDLFLWYQSLGLFLIVYAGLIIFKGLPCSQHNNVLKFAEAFSAGFFGIAGPFLTTSETPVLDYFIIDSARLVAYLYALKGLERLRESSDWGSLGMLLFVCGAASLIAGMMVGGQSIGEDLGEIIRRKLSARVCKTISAICVLFLGVMLIRHGVQIKPKLAGDVFWQQTQSSMNRALSN